ncbi:MAG: HAMP domain-containing histidine kinase [Cytophagales bacterium]|nr:HAMP domain-containing histidine kinase [Cytophagales bacterium]
MHRLSAGEPPIDLREHSQRLRYEAFSQLASQVNQAVSTEQVGKALARHVKFMLDAFRLRLLHVFEESTTVLELAGGTCTAWESPPAESPASTPPAGVQALEAQLLGTQLPLQLEGTALGEHAALRGSLFDHPKATRFFALPLRLGAQHAAVLSVAGKEASPFGVTDFRLMRLMGELLAGKLAQLCLANKVARRNQQLGEANEELLTLNEQIKRLNLVLEQQVEERTAQLRRANEELATIFYRTSHDFRRPLMTLLGLLNLAEMGAREMAAPAGDPATAGEVLRRGIVDALDIFRQGKGVVGELDAMLSKLSTLSGLETATARREPVDFTAVLAGLRHKFEPELAQYRVQLSLEVSVASPISGHAATLGVILENLLENAIQFRSADPVIGVRVYTEAPCTAGSDEAAFHDDEGPPAPGGTGSPARGSWLVLQIADNGEGIHPAWQDKIFDLYVRASERSKGNGLGLYVVRKAVEGLKGTVTVSSAPDQGAVFTVKFPV